MMELLVNPKLEEKVLQWQLRYTGSSHHNSSRPVTFYPTDGSSKLMEAGNEAIAPVLLKRGGV